MRPQVLETVTLTNDPNGIAEDQQLGAAGNLTLDGALVTDGVAFVAGFEDQAQRVRLESGGNISGADFTVTGTDANDVIISETITGPNATTADTTAFFSTVTQIAADASFATDVEIGWVIATGGVTKSFVVNSKEADFALALTVVADASPAPDFTYTVRHTADSPFDSYSTSFQVDADWLSTADLTAIVDVTGEGNIVFPVAAVDFIFTSYVAGTVKFTVRQGF